MLVSSDLNTNEWVQIQIPNTQDLLVIQFTGDFSLLTVFNVYNDCHNLDAINRLRAHLHSQAWGPEHGTAGATHSMWCGNLTSTTQCGTKSETAISSLHRHWRSH